MLTHAFLKLHAGENRYGWSSPLKWMEKNYKQM